MNGFRTASQIASFTLFAALLGYAYVFSAESGFLTLFLLLDPSISLVTIIAARTLSIAILPVCLLLVFSTICGRFFCGHLCPMGSLLDWAGQRDSGGKKTAERSFSHTKYGILCFLVAGAIFSVSFVFFLSPLALITRFFGMVLYPALSLWGHFFQEGLSWVPFPTIMETNFLMEDYVKQFSTGLFWFVFFLLLFLSNKLSSRFWCRNICPAGAVFALAARRPVLGRQVNDQCTNCQKCVPVCPMGAIPKQTPEKTLFEECIVCGRCENICPEHAITFGKSKKHAPHTRKCIDISRRQVLLSGFLGAGTALVTIADPSAPFVKTGEHSSPDNQAIRPPGSCAEPEFLSRCVRCGECMVACPTNTLQPQWLQTGFIGLFSPGPVFVQGFCSPTCHRCAQVCPTQAIQTLGIKERPWAKMGTAVIFKEKCLAWEQNKSCMVCDEVCPYNAIRFEKSKKHSVAVPFVLEDQCAGCGFCEHFCPQKSDPAIIVSSLGAIRTQAGTLRQEALTRGLSLTLASESQDAPSLLPQDGLAPGFEPL